MVDKPKLNFPRLIILAIIGAIVGVVIFLLVSGLVQQVNRSLASKVGVVVPEFVTEIYKGNLQQIKSGTVSVTFQPETIATYNRINSLLQLPPFNKFSEVNLLIAKDVNAAQLSKYGQIYQYGAFAVSGSYIYLHAEYGEEAYKVEDWVTNLFAALLTASSFNSISQEQLEAIAGAGGQYDISAATEWQDLTLWTDAELEKVIKVSSADVCHSTQLSQDASSDASDLNKIACISNLILNGQLAELPAKAQTRLSWLELKTEDYFYGLDIYTVANAEKTWAEVKLGLAKFPFKGWLESSGNNPPNLVFARNYQQVSSSQLSQLKTVLANAEWQLERDTVLGSDQSLGGTQTISTYTRSTILSNYRLEIRALDTANLLGDCIISEESDQEFCDVNSLYKNSGYYLELSLLATGI